MSGLFAEHEVVEAPDTGEWRYVRVAVERGVDRVGEAGSDGALTYKSREAVEVGRRVEVPLGRGNVSSAGIVIASGGEELLGGFAAARVKPILRDTGTGLPPNLVELARWIATYYICPLGMVLGIMLPAAVKHRTGLRAVTLIDRVGEDLEKIALEAAGKLTPAVKAAWESVGGIDRGVFPLKPESLALRIESKTLGPINKLVKLGLLKEVEVEEVRQTGGVATQMGIEQTDPTGASFALPGTRPELTAMQARVVEGISAERDAFGVHLIRGVTGSGKTEVYLRVLEGVLGAGKNAIVLVPEISLTPQTAGRFVERFRTAGVAVLHSGLSASQRHKEWTRVATGSARVVVGARSAIFAPMDKLGLIVVDEEHASDYKQDQLPRYHGRDVAIKRAHMEGCPIILGTATPSLETWVNAVGVSGKNGRAEGVRTGEGIEAGRHQGIETKAVETKKGVGKYRLWELTERIGGAKLPRVEVVDLAEERKIRQHLTGKRDAHLHLLGPTLEKAIGETLHAGGQVLLLLNRRGYATYIACPDSQCGWVMTCDDCDAKMIQHRVIAGQHPPKGVVRCHHCLAQKLLSEACPICEKRTIALGLGTQRIEEEIAKKFAAQLGGLIQATADAPATCPALMRVDGDTMNSAKDYFGVLSRFASGEIKVLLGTQMISKGLDFPNVRLVGVINADTALSLPDFRASERTFQLVSQVAGRAGRGSIPGRVIVQTIDPLAPAIVHAASHDYVTFAQEELATRRGAHPPLPPMARMVRIVFRDESFEKVQKHAAEVAAEIRAAADRRGSGGTAGTGAKLHVIGPMPCPVARIAGFHRYAIELTSSARMLIQDVLAEVRSKGMLVSDASTAVDVDPIALM